MLFEYIWIDSQGELRSKTKVINEFTNNWRFKMEDIDRKVEMLPLWNYDGSSTGQAEGKTSEVLIKPCSIYNNPFIDNGYLVMCDTYLPDMKPLPTNSRYNAQIIFDRYKEQRPMYGIEQEFFIKNKEGYVLGFEDGNKPESQGKYYCGVGTGRALGRPFIMKAFNNCLKAGLKLTGMNAEVAPGQWEFQVCDYGINVCDQLYIMRYILHRTAEEYDYIIDFHPKPIDSTDWNGSGCHTNFSTEKTRGNDGIIHIYESITNIGRYHDVFMKEYGKDNDMRMTGALETSSFDKFSYGTGDRTASIRIPNNCVTDGRGYFEDRRPASNMDPYVVTSLLLKYSN